MRCRPFTRAVLPAAVGLAAVLSLVAARPAAAIDVAVNGQPMYFTGVRPLHINGRVFIPLRDVAETLGASVQWNSTSRTVIGSREGRSFTLPISSYTAYVGGNPVRLDEPARIIAGQTMVPLRFVAEALGAEVAWRPAQQLVAINLEGVDAVAGTREEQVVIPADTVVRVELDESISSENARRGDRVSATVDNDDRSRFPQGTRFEGRVTEVQRASRDKPGIIDMAFDRVVLPDGTAMAISGNLASLNEDDVIRRDDGSLESRRVEGRGNRFDWKWVGYGAAGGAVLGTIFGGNLLRGALLGGLGGAVYSYLNRGKSRDFKDVELSRGTEFGVALNERVAFADRSDYEYPR